jgi:site-specific DNA-cytosine methylase
MGSAKFIIRALTSLGYQVQFSVLQAAEHGTPQSRMRVFFWGSKPGYALPKYPEPTHLFAGGRAPKPTRRTRRSAPHYSVTVGGAISDLPAFDWTMEIPGESAVDRAARNRRAVTKVRLLDGRHSKIGPEIPVSYSRGTLSEYQRELRRHVKGNKVHNHYTCRWIDETMLRVLKIPLRPGANHLDLPAEEDMKCLRSKDSAAPKHSFYQDRYRRLDYDKAFQTCLCKIDPSGKNGSVSLAQSIIFA